ncbi:unnamed protein product [Alternaria alternata]
MATIPSHQCIRLLVAIYLKIKGFSEIKVDKVKDAIAKSQPSGGGFQTAHELGHLRKRVIKISTGSKALDAVLGGGFQTMSISEVFGEIRCGKTQLSHTMSVIAQLPKDMGGAEGKVADIDTEGTFRPERIAQIAERFGVDPETAQDNITYARAVNSEHQMELLNKVAEFFVSNEYRLLIIDSIMALFRFRAILERALSSLSADGRKPIGGHILAHASATRILLRKGRGEERVAKIQDSPDMPEKEATYIITNGGINDAEKL